LGHIVVTFVIPHLQTTFSA